MLPNKSVSYGHPARVTPIRAHLARPSGPPLDVHGYEEIGVLTDTPLRGRLSVYISLALRALRSMYTVMKKSVSCRTPLCLLRLSTARSAPASTHSPASCHLPLSPSPPLHPHLRSTPAVHHPASLPSQPRPCVCPLPPPLSALVAAPMCMHPGTSPAAVGPQSGVCSPHSCPMGPCRMRSDVADAPRGQGASGRTPIFS